MFEWGFSREEVGLSDKAELEEMGVKIYGRDSDICSVVVKEALILVEN